MYKFQFRHDEDCNCKPILPKELEGKYLSIEEGVRAVFDFMASRKYLDCETGTFIKNVDRPYSTGTKSKTYSFDKLQLWIYSLYHVDSDNFLTLACKTIQDTNLMTNITLWLVEVED